MYICRKYKTLILFFAALVLGLQSFAQGTALDQARDLANAKDYPKAIDAYKRLYEQTPSDQAVYKEYLQLLTDAKEYSKAEDLYKQLYAKTPLDPDIYNGYLSLLLAQKEYKQAEKIIQQQLQLKQHDPLPFIDMGKLYLATGKEKKANEQFENAVLSLNGDDMLTQQVANAFAAIGRDDYALKTYERARDMLRNNFVYSGPLSRLYAKQGDIDKAVSALLDGGVPFMNNASDDTKASLMDIYGNDPKKLALVQKALVKKINEQPENPFFAELLTWIYTQKDDWEGAMIQIQALDERNREQGQRLLDFARFAVKEHREEWALKIYAAILEKGKESPYYSIAESEQLAIRFDQLVQSPSYKKEDALALAKEYAVFLNQNPQYYTIETVKDYATLLAQYADSVQAAINVLDKAIKEPTSRRDFAGACKLQMGDYYILQGKIWDASLIYSQVDKAFREDALGEEARFRNAKLSYYTGDFDWAQGQLSVLKASTSELIANDALYLSVLITENITPDSNYVPIRRFAYADLLLFQNKDKEAAALFDSLTTYYPEHPLTDDILMQRAKLAQKQHDYTKALTYLEEIHTKHGKDVLGDDAVFKEAEIYEKYLKNPADAKRYYEQLILEYPGSTYVQTARNRVTAIDQGTILP